MMKGKEEKKKHTSTKLLIMSEPTDERESKKNKRKSSLQSIQLNTKKSGGAVPFLFSSLRVLAWKLVGNRLCNQQLATQSQYHTILLLQLLALLLSKKRQPLISEKTTR